MKVQNYLNDSKILALTTLTDSNFSLTVNDDYLTVINNRKKLMEQTGIKDIVFLNQVHGTEIVKVDKSMKQKGLFLADDAITADAIYTRTKGLALTILHADCMPILVYSVKHSLVGAIHAGWKGSIKEITYNSIKTIINNESIPVSDLYVTLGPAINYIHLRFDKNVLKYFTNKDYYPVLKKVNDSYLLDLVQLNLIQLRKAGIDLKKVTIVNQNTFTNLNFNSYRRNKDCGRNLTLICLK